MAIVLRHSDPGVKSAMRHPALAGLKTLARGSFCQVYDKGDTVLKLTADHIQYYFSADCYAPEGPYFPKLIKDHGCVGSTKHGLDLYLMEMEKLSPIGRKASIDVKRLRKELLSLTNQHIDVKADGRRPDQMRMASYKGLGAVIEHLQNPGLVDALDCLRTWMSNYDACCDFHGKNLMMRGDQLILNDVVCDPKAVAEIIWADW